MRRRKWTERKGQSLERKAQVLWKKGKEKLRRKGAIVKESGVKFTFSQAGLGDDDNEVCKWSN
jgi:hypothetical protein